MTTAKRRESELERRLHEWAKEWGGGKYRSESEGGGGSWLASMMKWHGRPPSGLGYVPIDTPADDVQDAVIALGAQNGGWIPACVLRAEYFSAAPKQEKLRRLGSIGMPMDESRYSRHLRVAKVHVAAWLRIPFKDPLDEDGQIAMLEHLIESD